MVSAYTHTDVALGEGKRQGGLWLSAGLEPKFPLWLGLVSLPLTFWVTHDGFCPLQAEGHWGVRSHNAGGELCGGEARADSTGDKYFSWASNAFGVLFSPLCSTAASTQCLQLQGTYLG